MPIIVRMNRPLFIAFLALWAGVLCLACQPEKQQQVAEKQATSAPAAPIVQVRHATGFSLAPQANGSTLLSVVNTQRQDTLRYWLVPKNAPDTLRQPKNTLRIEVPVAQVVCTSTTHLPYLDLLQQAKTLVGFPQPKLISTPALVKRVRTRQIANIGVPNALNVEAVLALQPEIIMAFAMGSAPPSLQQLAQSGIPVLYNTDWQESTPLGLAEWIKVWGVLLGQEARADSAFNAIESRYLTLQNKVKALPAISGDSLTILSGSMYGDSWYVPGGQSFIAQYFAHAGGRYAWQQDSTRGSLALSFEAVYQKAATANYWIGVGQYSTLKDLQADNPRYAGFAAFGQQQVYSYTPPNLQGGNPYFEQAYARPDLMLADIVAILHPEVLPQHQPNFFYRIR